jgi:hypothetical protein
VPVDLIDPYAYEGPWPPDPSWDEPLVPTPEQAPVPDVALMPQAPAPEAAQARAAADALFAQQPEVKLGMPRPVESVDPIDESLIELDEPDIDMSQLDTAPGPGAQIGDISLPVDFGDVPEEQLRADEAAAEQGRLAGLSSADLALEQFDANQAAEQEAATGRLEARKAERRGAQMAEDTYRAAMERAATERRIINAERERLANERVDPDGWRSSRTLFQTIAMYTAGIVGGLLQSRTGGQNQGLAMINNEIERHIEAQKANLAQRRAMLGDRAASVSEQEAQAANDLRMGQAFYEATYQRAIEDVEADKQQFDPLGTAYRNREAFQRQMMAEQAKAAADFDRANEDREIKRGEFDLKVFQANETARHNMAQEQAAARKAAGAGGGSAAASKLKKTATQWNADYGGGVPEDGTPLTLADYKARVEAKKSVKSLNDPSEADKEIRDLAIGDPRKKGETLRNADDSVYIPPAHAAPALQKQMSAASQVVNIIDEIDAIRSQVGGESSWGNSDARQRLDALQNQLVILQKSGTEGMSSDEDMKKLAAAVGADDVASFRAQAAGLKQGRINTVNALNAELRAKKYTGEAVTFPNLSAKAKQTPDQREFAKLKVKPTGEKGQSVPTAAVLSPVGAAARVIESAVRGEDPDAALGTDERGQIDAWAKAASAGDPEARSFIEGLAADDTRGPAIRKYARGILAHVQAEELTRATGKRPGDKGFLKALRTAVGYTSESDDEDDE